MRMVRLTTCVDGFEARVVAARLGAEGVVWSLRGGHDGPIALGAVEVLVDADDLVTAREILDDGGSDLVLAPSDAEPEPETTGRDVWVIVLVLLVAILFAVARIAVSYS